MFPLTCVSRALLRSWKVYVKLLIKPSGSGFVWYYAALLIALYWSMTTLTSLGDQGHFIDNLSLRVSKGVIFEAER